MADQEEKKIKSITETGVIEEQTGIFNGYFGIPSVVTWFVGVILVIWSFLDAFLIDALGIGAGALAIWWIITAIICCFVHFLTKTIVSYKILHMSYINKQSYQIAGMKSSLEKLSKQLTEMEKKIEELEKAE